MHRGCVMRIVTGSADKTARVWEIDDDEDRIDLTFHNRFDSVGAPVDGSKQHVRTLTGHDGAVHSVCVSPDGQRIVTGSADGTARVWKLTDGALVRTLEGHAGGVLSVCVSPDGERIVTGSADETARVWAMADGALVRTLEGHSAAGRVLSSRTYPSGAGMYVCSNNSSVKSVCVSPDSKHLVTGSADGMARVWLMADGALVHTLEGHTGAVRSVCVSPDGARIVTASNDQTARWWRLADGKCLGRTKGANWSERHGGEVSSARCLGEYIVTGSYDGTARMWRMADGRPEPERELDVMRPVHSVCVSPDSKHLVTGSADGMARVWRTADGKALLGQELWGHTDTVLSVCFAPEPQSPAADPPAIVARAAGKRPRQDESASSASPWPPGVTSASPWT